MDNLSEMFELQRQLQRDTYGADPGEIADPEERSQFVKDMILALTDELHEALAEVGWKPWATKRHINSEEFKGELVDAFHFFMNLCLVAGMTPNELHTRYVEKRNRNIERQKTGYDGVDGKCSVCHRAFDDLAKAWGLPLDMVKEGDILLTDAGAVKRGPVCRECNGATVIVDD